MFQDFHIWIFSTAGWSDTNALTQTMMSNIKVEDSRNGTYSGLLKKAIGNSKDSAGVSVVLETRT